LRFAYNFIVSYSNRIIQFRDFSAEIIGQVGGICANVNVYLGSPSTGGLFGQVFENLSGADTRTVPDEDVNLFDFVKKGDPVQSSS
jgi:hypothetical protein